MQRENILSKPHTCNKKNPTYILHVQECKSFKYDLDLQNKDISHIGQIGRLFTTC